MQPVTDNNVLSTIGSILGSLSLAVTIIISILTQRNKHKKVKNLNLYNHSIFASINHLKNVKLKTMKDVGSRIKTEAIRSLAEMFLSAYSDALKEQVESVMKHNVLKLEELHPTAIKILEETIKKVKFPDDFVDMIMKTAGVRLDASYQQIANKIQDASGVYGKNNKAKLYDTFDDLQITVPMIISDFISTARLMNGTLEKFLTEQRR